MAWIRACGGGSPAIPDGKTVTPINDVTIWQQCAGIANPTYTTLAEILADVGVLSVLMASDNAVDYLVRSKTFASDICADSNAMQYIGANNYCADTLLNDADWLHAIFESSYKDSVLNAQIPTMTSNNQPSGVASSTSDYSGSTTAFRAFDKTSNGWLSVKSQAPSYVEYAFPSDIVPKVVTMKAGAYSAGSAISDKLQMSKDDSTFVDIKICSVSATGQTFTQEMPGNTEEYRYFRVYCQNGQYASNGDLVYIEEFMVYGREDV